MKNKAVENIKQFYRTSELFKGKSILVTGGTGSIGSSIVEHLLIYKPRVIRIYSNDENATSEMCRRYAGNTTLRFLVGDVRDKDRLSLAMKDIDIVYHCAAMKHVSVCEYNPFEAIRTNVIGTQNIIELALSNHVEQVVNISTDKAVNPINTMGVTKLLAEKLICDVSSFSKYTRYCNVRFGNVRMSRGSVIPIFEEQIKKGGPVTVTSKDMTRYMMSIDEAVELVFKATELSNGGETFIFKMEEYSIIELAESMIGMQDVGIKITGSVKGEKMHEELLTKNEKQDAINYDDKLIIVNPNGRYEQNIAEA